MKKREEKKRKKKKKEKKKKEKKKKEKNTRKSPLLSKLVFQLLFLSTIPPQTLLQ